MLKVNQKNEAWGLKISFEKISIRHHLCLINNTIGFHFNTSYLSRRRSL